MARRGRTSVRETEVSFPGRIDILLEEQDELTNKRANRPGGAALSGWYLSEGAVP
jgi:hypothetical protein